MTKPRSKSRRHTARKSDKSAQQRRIQLQLQNKKGEKP